MTRAIRHRLIDILEAIDTADVSIEGRSAADIENDGTLRFAVQMALVIIAEAANHLPRELTAAYPDVPSLAWGADQAPLLPPRQPDGLGRGHEGLPRPSGNGRANARRRSALAY